LQGREEASRTEVPDELLMALTAAGDHAAYRALVDRHLNRMLAVAQRMLGNRADAEDVAQEAFLRIWIHAKRWQPNHAKFTTWSYRILMNLCIDQRRRPVMNSLDGIEEKADPSPDVSEALHRQQLARHVAEAVANLPETQRAVIALCYYEEVSNIEAAEVLSTTVGAVESLLVRARRRLREILQHSFPHTREHHHDT